MDLLLLLVVAWERAARHPGLHTELIRTRMLGEFRLHGDSSRSLKNVFVPADGVLVTAIVPSRAGVTLVTVVKAVKSTVGLLSTR
jgi:hypothetical protein